MGVKGRNADPKEVNYFEDPTEKNIVAHVHVSRTPPPSVFLKDEL